MALRSLDNALPLTSSERPKKQVKVAIPPIQKQFVNDENRAPTDTSLPRISNPSLIQNPPSRDVIHLSVEGSKIVVKEILKILKEVDWEPSLHWKSMRTEFPEDSPYYFLTPDGKMTITVSETTLRWKTQWE